MENTIYVRTENDGYETFNLHIINMFASYALTLEPLREVTFEAGLLSALDEEMENNIDLEAYKKDYEKINNVMMGKKLLADTLQLMVIEQTFRCDGITPQALEYYKVISAEYQKYFAISKEIEENIIKK